MMSGGSITFRVVGLKSWELRARLMHAANLGTTAEFEAISLDDPSFEPVTHVFVVRVETAHFDGPQAFDVVDQDRHWFRLPLVDGVGEVEFHVII